MSYVTIKFDNDAAAKEFMSWLDGQGEQDYWTWLSYRDADDVKVQTIKYNYNTNTITCT